MADAQHDTDSSVFIRSGTNIDNVTGSFAITTNPVPVSGAVSVTGGQVTLGTGTNFIGFTSGNTTTQVDSAFIPSGNVYIQSGANWTGVGSVFIAGGSANNTVAGSVHIESSAGSSVLTWGTNVSGNAVQATGASISLNRGLNVKAGNDISGNIYAGQSGLTAGSPIDSTGYELGPGESKFFPIDDANKIYLIGSPNTANQTAFISVM